jgi:hypothetical protein
MHITFRDTSHSLNYGSSTLKYCCRYIAWKTKHSISLWRNLEKNVTGFPHTSMHCARTHQTEYNAMYGVDTLYISKGKRYTWPHGQQGVTVSQGTSFSAYVLRKPMRVTHTIPIQPIILSHMPPWHQQSPRNWYRMMHAILSYPFPTTPSSDIKQLICAEDTGTSGWLEKNQAATRIFKGLVDWYASNLTSPNLTWYISAAATTELQLQLDRPLRC